MMNSLKQVVLVICMFGILLVGGVPALAASGTGDVDGWRHEKLVVSSGKEAWVDLVLPVGTEVILVEAVTSRKADVTLRMFGINVPPLTSGLATLMMVKGYDFKSLPPKNRLRVLADGKAGEQVPIDVYYRGLPHRDAKKPLQLIVDICTLKNAEMRLSADLMKGVTGYMTEIFRRQGIELSIKTLELPARWAKIHGEENLQKLFAARFGRMTPGAIKILMVDELEVPEFGLCDSSVAISLGLPAPSSPYLSHLAGVAIPVRDFTSTTAPIDTASAHVGNYIIHELFHALGLPHTMEFDKSRRDSFRSTADNTDSNMMSPMAPRISCPEVTAEQRDYLRQHPLIREPARAGN
ncbi:MAG TPA: hypothetical protein PKO06_10145 [Candidatus Ozemobacteraceae bacterium]|nr:hypothetical protein [Candidatus Ozemobacteraceae bacterium]